MARDQKNFDNFLYVDDNAVSWTKRGEVAIAMAGIDGRATGTGAPTWVDGPRMSVRKVTFQDAVTFRTVTHVVYTAAAYAGIALGAVIAVPVSGLATTVNYTAIKKLPEKQPSRGVSRKLADT